MLDTHACMRAHARAHTHTLHMYTHYTCTLAMRHSSQEYPLLSFQEVKEISFDIELVSRGRVTIDITVPDMEVKPVLLSSCDSVDPYFSQS